ncbi:hypothetical protein THAOC_30729, partial [Thalassiosira oceanica]
MIENLPECPSRALLLLSKQCPPRRPLTEVSLGEKLPRFVRKAASRDRLVELYKFLSIDERRADVLDRRQRSPRGRSAASSRPPQLPRGGGRGRKKDTRRRSAGVQRPTERRAGRSLERRPARLSPAVCGVHSERPAPRGKPKAARRGPPRRAPRERHRRLSTTASTTSRNSTGSHDKRRSTPSDRREDPRGGSAAEGSDRRRPVPLIAFASGGLRRSSFGLALPSRGPHLGGGEVRRPPDTYLPAGSPSGGRRRSPSGLALLSSSPSAGGIRRGGREGSDRPARRGKGTDDE